ncbi:MAG: hypothetical protein ABSA67_07970 [Candidatus Brocadiia bacterium]|jgi:hypothetical protein
MAIEMAKPSKAGRASEQLLRRVSARQRLAEIARRLHFFLLILAALYAVLLCCARLLAILPNRFTPVTLLAPLVLAPVLALIFSRRPSAAEAARLVDARMGTKDLFLTALLIEPALGEFKPLVLREAEERAGSIRAAEVAPLRWKRGFRNLALAMAALTAGVLFLPQLDPFGREQARQRVLNRQKQLEESRKEVALRSALLKRQPLDAELSKEVGQQLAELKTAFNAMKPPDKQANLAVLNLEQKNLTDLWRQAGERKLKEAFDRTPPAQQFGGGPPKLAEWKEQLERGDARKLNKELEELKDLAQKLAEMPQNDDADKLREQMKERMTALADFMARDLNSLPANAALNRALDQLAEAGAAGLSADALKGLQESLKLTELEVASLAQNIRDLKALEEALRALQLAKRLNDAGELDGEAGKALQGMEDYAALYAELLERAQEVGMGTEGEGLAASARPEDDSVKSDFKSEQSRSALTAGKILLQWKTQGMSDVGSTEENYKEKVSEVKQGVSEAILQEQVPPGYHEAIRKYFETVGEDVAKPSGR